LEKDDGTTSLHWAEYEGRKEIVNLIQNYEKKDENNYEYCVIS